MLERKTDNAPPNKRRFGDFSEDVTMTTSGGEWVAVPVPGQADRWDWVPAEQPASPDGGPGRWHLVYGSPPSGDGTWEWFPAGGAAPAPPVAAPDYGAAQPGFGAAQPGSGAAQPAYGAAQPAYGTAQPYPAPLGPPRRSLKLPLLITGAVLSVLALGAVALVALSGGDDGKDKEAIVALVKHVATAEEGTEVCSSHLTQEFVRTVFGSLSTCEDPGDDPDRSVAATDATVTDLDVDGDTATATVTEVGGDADGASGRWEFAREADIWRVSAWSADYLRSNFTATLGENYRADAEDDPFRDAGVRGCVKDKLVGLDDSAFLDTAYALFRDTPEGTKKLLSFLSACPSDIPGVSALRKLFEDGFREGVGDDIPPAGTECIVLEMREELSDREIEDLVIEQTSSPDLQQRIEAIALGCAGGSASDIPTPGDLGFGT